MLQLAPLVKSSPLSEGGLKKKRLKNFLQNVLENICMGVSFFIKLRAQYNTCNLVKKDSSADISLSILRKF